MMPLEQWRREVSAHLDKIEAGAMMCLSHAEQLPLRPSFETTAENALADCATTLRRALGRVERAQAIFREKRIGR
jgi:hypothetical protein